MKRNSGLRLGTLPEVIVLSTDGKLVVYEENYDRGQTSSSSPTIVDGDGVGTSAATLPSTPVSRNSSDIPPPVNNPMPLRWYRPPEEGVEVDTTLRLSNYVAGNPNIPPAPAMIDPTPPLGWFRPGFFDGVEYDEVDTTLSLRPPGSNSTDHNRSRMLLQAEEEKRDKSRKLLQAEEEKRMAEEEEKRKVEEGERKVEKGKRKVEKGKRKVEADDGDDPPKKVRRARRNNNGDDEDQRPLVPIELIPGLQNIVSGNGTRPTFLYRKKLVESDVRRDQNRLFVTRRERMMEFLREEEAAAVDGGGKGLKIVGVDGGGKVYENLGLRKWASLKMTVINSDWWRMVGANNAITGDVVEIWGYRENEKPFFAFNFRRDQNQNQNESGGDDINAASTSGTKEY